MIVLLTVGRPETFDEIVRRKSLATLHTAETLGMPNSVEQIVAIALSWLVTRGTGWSKESKMTILAVLFPIFHHIIVRLQNCVTVHTGEALGMPHLVHCCHQRSNNVLSTGDAWPLHWWWGVLVVQVM